MDKRRGQRVDVEAARVDREEKAQPSEREEVALALKKHKKTHLSYLASTDWMFSNPHFQEYREHMDSYL